MGEAEAAYFECRMGFLEVIDAPTVAVLATPKDKNGDATS